MRYSTRSSFRFVSLLCGCCAIALIAAADQPPAPSPVKPATQPADEPAANAPMRRWFDRLADADPKVRDQAKTDLMGLSPADLPKLRQLVIEHQPILPAQASALHDIVTQAFLAGEAYESQDGEQTTITGNQSPFFLGIEWTNIVDTDDSRLGVTVEYRLPGFPSYRYLRTGDMILGVVFDPTASILQLPNVETHTHEQLVTAIASKPNAQDITLLILRDGEQMRIALKMAPRPALADRFNAGALTAFKADRADRADAYWQENFVPLLESRDEGEVAAE